jgi:hypothetical protein
MSLWAVAPKGSIFALTLRALAALRAHVGLGMDVEAALRFPVSIFVIDHMIYNGLYYFISKLAAHQKRQITLPEEW